MGVKGGGLLALVAKRHRQSTGISTLWRVTVHSWRPERLLVDVAVARVWCPVREAMGRFMLGCVVSAYCRRCTVHQWWCHQCRVQCGQIYKKWAPWGQLTGRRRLLRTSGSQCVPCGTRPSRTERRNSSGGTCTRPRTRRRNRTGGGALGIRRPRWCSSLGRGALRPSRR